MTPIQIIAFAVAFCMYVFLPDVDLYLWPILHHRSIVTHSLLPLLLLLIFGRGVSAYLVMGAALGLAVHMAADAASPPVGYGAVWLPFPFVISLGEGSRYWLLANALGGYLMAFSLMHRHLQVQHLTFAASLSLGLALGYCIFHDEGLIQTLLVLVCGFAAWVFVRFWMRL